MSNHQMVLPGTPSQQSIAGAGILAGAAVALIGAIVLGAQTNWIGFGLLLVVTIILAILGCAILMIAAFNNYATSTDEEAEAAYDRSFPKG